MSGRLAAAIVLMLGAGTAASADLGRMFFTPTQRATLDNARKPNIRGEVGSDNAQAAPVPQNVSVNGVVQRSDGKSTIWLNNRPVAEPQAGGINVMPSKNDNRVKLTVPKSGRSVELKVGQSVEIVSGTIEEGYSRRSPPKPEPSPAGKPGATSAETPQPQTAPRQPRRARDLQDQYEPGPPAPTEPDAPGAVTPGGNRRGSY